MIRRGASRARPRRTSRAPGRRGRAPRHACSRPLTVVSAPATIWSVPISTALVAVPSGTKLSTARTDHRRRPMPASARSARIASATPPPVRAALVDHQHRADRRRLLADRLVGERVEPAQVEHPRGDLVLLAQAPRRLEREAQAIAVADDQEVGGPGVERAVDADLAGQQRGRGWRDSRSASRRRHRSRRSFSW